MTPTSRGARPLIALWATGLSVVWASPGRAADPIASGRVPDPPLPTVSLGFETYTLPSNGLTVILHENHRLPLVAVHVGYRAGPINEARGRTGFAHLFEHLMFDGSAHVKEEQHSLLLQAAGASEENASTSDDSTDYYETVPSHQLALALWLESDRMGFLGDAMSLAKLQKQRDVVMNERRQRIDNQPYGASYEALVHTLFAPEHPYYGMVIGSMEDLEAASLEDVRRFYASYYAPANATLTIAGDLDVAATKALVQRYFGTLPARPVPKVPQVITSPITAARRVEVSEPVMLAQVQIAWLTPPYFQPGDAEADVLATILGGGTSSRLHKKLVYQAEIAQAVSAYQSSSALASTFVITATARPGVDAATLEAALLTEIERVRTEPCSAAEVARARNRLVTDSLSALQGMARVAERLNTYQHYLGRPGYLAEDLARYQAMTPAGLLSFAAEVLAPERSVTVLTVPQSAAGGS